MTVDRPAPSAQTKKDIVLILSLELVAAWLAVFSFRFIDSRLAAGVVAGTGFVALGGFILWWTRRWQGRRHSGLFWAAHLHLWLSAVPLLVTRLFVSGDLSEVELAGLRVDQFHRWSESVYLILIVMTIGDLMRTLFGRPGFGRPN